MECKAKALFDKKQNPLLLNVSCLNIKKETITYNKMQENFKFNGIELQFYLSIFIRQKHSLHLNN